VVFGGDAGSRPPAASNKLESSRCYDIAETNWTMTVSDNGIGKPEGSPGKIVPGLGTRIVEALVKQLDSRVEISRHPHGTMVSIIHSPLTSRLLVAA
jgi:two-component sensor histidine kinase